MSLPSNAPATELPVSTQRKSMLAALAILLPAAAFVAAPASAAVTSNKPVHHAVHKVATHHVIHHSHHVVHHVSTHRVVKPVTHTSS